MAAESSMRGDPFLLGMFRDELVSAAETLDSGLRESGVSGNLEPLVRAAHSIRGAARIVGLDAASTLAGAMEDALDAVRKGTAAPAPAAAETLARATALFLELAAIEPTDIPDAIETRSTDMGTYTAALREGPGPVSTSGAEYSAVTPPAPTVSQPSVVSSEAVPPGGGADAADLFMMDLFRVEVENHTRSLESGLVDAERDPSPERMEPLMRAAHSIKGAARIVGLAGAVGLAHAMEDVLEASRKGMLALRSGHIDLLLRANDIFASLVPVAPEEIPACLAARAQEMDELGRLLGESMTAPPEGPQAAAAPSSASPASGTASPEPSTASASAPSAPPRSADASAPRKESPAREERSVRVLAENLDRLIGLAGESLVQAKFTKTFSQSMLRIKNIQTELAAMLEDLVLSPKYGALSDEAFHTVGEALKLLDQLQDVLIRQMDQFERLSRRLEFHAERLYADVVANRMRPFADGLHGFPRLVRDLSQSLGKKVSFTVDGGSTRVDRDILERLEAPLNHLVRNAIDHGIETPDARAALGKPPEGRIVLDARHFFGVLNITLTDDGRGIDPDRIREAIVRKGLSVEEMARNMNQTELFDFLFLPGFSTAKSVTEVSGRGVGLDVVASMVHEVGGTVRVESKVGEGTTFHLQLPLTLSVIRTLVVEIAGEYYALPLSRIDRVLEIDPSDLHVVEDRQFCTVDGDHIGVIDAREILQTPPGPNSSERLSIAIISDRLTRYGIVVDRFRGERELVVRPLDPQFGKIPNVSSGAILGDGSPALILDVDDLVRSIDNRLTHGRLHHVGERGHEAGAARKRVLVVEDSLTVRQVERKLLENDGYEVTVAVDGMDGWNALQGERFDLVVSDVDMPRMNGIELVRRIREDPKFRDIPVMIISYKDREEDRLKGLEAGANYYLSKGSFHDESLIRAVRDLIGEP